MKSPTEFNCYKEFTNHWVLECPKGGRGQYRKMADYLSTSTVIISQIFKGERELNEDQAHALSYFFNLNKVEREYYLVLVQLARAGTHKLKEFYLEKLLELKSKNQELKNILPQDINLTEEDKARFYSNWYYSGIRLLSGIQGQNTIEQLAKRFDLPRELVAEVVDFLVDRGLCRQQDGVIHMGARRVHLDAKSPYIKTRSLDWRMKAMEKIEMKGPEEIFFTAPFSVSEKGAKKIHDRLREVIKDVSDEVTSRAPEKLYCLNIDYFNF